MLHPTPNDQPAEAGAGDAQEQRIRPNAPALDLDPTWRAGRKLSEARRQLGLSLDEVAERIRVRREFLEALEQMNVKLLPGKAYALAFLRSYARALGIDERAIVDQFQDESALTRDGAEKQIRNPSSKPHRERPWMFALALVVIGAVFVGWRALQQRVDVEAPPVEQTAVLGSSSPGPTNGAADIRVIEIKAIADGWLEARGPNGTVFFSETLRAGQVYSPDPSPGWTLHARDGAAFEVFVNGVSAGPLGEAGMPVLGRSIDEMEPISQVQIASPRG